MNRAAWAEIDLDGLAHNLKAIRTWLYENGAGGAKVMAVVKAGASGHGIAEIAAALRCNGVTHLAVATVAEALLARRANPEAEILVLGYAPPAAFDDAIEQDISLALTSLRQARLLDEASRRRGKRAKAHIKVNTGMNRLGFDWNEAGMREAEQIGSLTGIDVRGLFTHCPAAGAADRALIDLQAKRLLQFAATLRSSGMQLPCVHMANSSTVLEHPEYAMDMVRVSALVFGMNPAVASGRKLDVRPFLSVRAEIVQERWIEPGEGVSYGLKWIAQRRSRIGVLPLGHIDIPIRGVTNGYVLVPGGRAPYVGTVCMDQVMVDLTDTEAREGDVATLLGRGNGEEITLFQLAEQCGMEPFRFLCGVSARLPRVYFKDGVWVSEKEAGTVV